MLYTFNQSCGSALSIFNQINMGDQIVEAYSRCGLTTDLYRFKNISLSIKVNVRKIRPTFLLALFTLLLNMFCELQRWIKRCT